MKKYITTDITEIKSSRLLQTAIGQQLGKSRKKMYRFLNYLYYQYWGTKIEDLNKINQ